MGEYIVQIGKKAQKETELIYRSGDKSSINKIEKILQELITNPYEGTGNPEQLKYELKGFWSRRINKRDRIVYSINQSIVTVNVISALGHYTDT
jgi:toxin YoeB